MVLSAPRKLSVGSSLVAFTLTVANVGLLVVSICACVLAAYFYFLPQAPRALGMSGDGALEVLGVIGGGGVLVSFVGLLAVAEESSFLCGLHVCLVAVLGALSGFAGFFFLALRANMQSRLQDAWSACGQACRRSTELALHCCGYETADTAGCAVSDPSAACGHALAEAQAPVYIALVAAPLGLVAVHMACVLMARHMARQYRAMHNSPRGPSLRGLSDVPRVRSDAERRESAAAKLPESYKASPPVALSLRTK